MSAYARDQDEARNAWTSVYPFEPYQGGLGVSLNCTTSTSRAKLAMDNDVNTAVIVNTGSVYAFVRLGSQDVVATTDCMAIPPNGGVTVTLYNVDTPIPMYVSGITATGSTLIQVTTGYGN